MAKGGNEITWLDYAPAGRKLDLEVFPFSNLRARATDAQIAASHRYTFHMLICVTRGSVTQRIDFEPVRCEVGSVLVLRPGQAHSFGGDDWEGLLVFFRSEFLPSSAETLSELLPALGLDRLPNHMNLPESDYLAVAEAIGRMQQDSSGDAQPAAVHGLLRYQLCALLLRLTILYDREVNTDGNRRGLQRFAGFRTLVEQNYATWHQVVQYAAALGCTEKSLTRATLNATGLSAKDFVSQRISLEAKRLLAHTDKPVYLIADGLGFDEATNFAKFFRRKTGLTPRQFRQRQR